MSKTLILNDNETTPLISFIFSVLQLFPVPNKLSELSNYSDYLLFIWFCILRHQLIISREISAIIKRSSSHLLFCLSPFSSHWSFHLVFLSIYLLARLLQLNINRLHMLTCLSVSVNKCPFHSISFALTFLSLNISKVTAHGLCVSSSWKHWFWQHFLAFGWVEGHVPDHAIAKEIENAKSTESAQDLVLEIETVSANVTEKSASTAIGGRSFPFSIK